MQTRAADTPTADEPPSHSPAVSRPARWRSVAWPLLAIVAVVAVLAASLAVWQRRLVFDTEQWVETVAPLPQEPAVAGAIGTFVADGVIERLDLEAEIAGRLPEIVAPLSPALTEAVRGRLEVITARLVASDGFNKVWVAMNRQAHRAAVDVLRSGGALDATDGVATLNLLPLIAAVLREADERGLPVVPEGSTVPEISAETPPDAARAELAEALDRRIPDGFGEVVVYRGDELAQLQQAVKLVDRLITLLIVLAAALVVAAVVVAPNRRRAMVRIGLAIALSVLAVRAAVPTLREMLIRAVATGDGPVVATVFDRVVRTAYEEFLFVLGLAVLAVLMAFLSGSSRPARTVRAVAAGTAEPTGIVGVLGRHADAARVVGLLALIVWVIAAEQTGPTFLAAFVVGVVWAVVVSRCERSVEASAVEPATDTPNDSVPPLEAAAG